MKSKPMLTLNGLSVLLFSGNVPLLLGHQPVFEHVRSLPLLLELVPDLAVLSLPVLRAHRNCYHLAQHPYLDLSFR